MNLQTYPWNSVKKHKQLSRATESKVDKKRRGQPRGWENPHNILRCRYRRWYDT